MKIEHPANTAPLYRCGVMSWIGFGSKSVQGCKVQANHAGFRRSP
jgi:hypothetical protein